MDAITRDRLLAVLRQVVLWALAAAGLYQASRLSYLLFHCLAEIFSVVIAAGVFIVAWNSRRFQTSDYLTFMGLAFLFIAALDTLHMLYFRGMNIFEHDDGNRATQLWLAARSVQALSFLIAPVYLRRTVRPALVLAAYALLTGLLLLSIFHWGVFPRCLVEDPALGTRLTTFKIAAEYLICAALVGATVFLIRRRHRLDRYVLALVLGSLVVTIAAELAFTLYDRVSGEWNLIGHALKIVAYYLMYKAIIETGIARPYQLMFWDLRQREDELRHSEERYRSLVELSPEAIIVHRDGQVLYANPAAARLLAAAKPADLIGRNLADFTDDARRAVCACARADAAPLQQPHEGRIMRLDRTVVDVACTAAPAVYAGTPAVQVVLQDITHRKQAEEALRKAKAAAEEASSAKDRFLAVLSHELRNPLNPVLMSVSALLRRDDLDDDTRRMLQSIRRNVEMEVRLIDDLLDVTRIVAGRMPLDLRDVDVHEVLAASLEVCRGDIEARSLAVGVVLEASDHHVRADQARLGQVFWNLIRNAVKFTPPNGRIGIRTFNSSPPGPSPSPSVAPGPSRIVIEVSDTGMGIEPDALSRIFNAFEQADAAVARRFGGLGLGLTIARAIVEMHGGTITASSPGPGKGATFTVALPTVPAPSPSPPAVVSPPPPLARPLSVLVVEDHEDTLRLIVRLLQEAGHDVAAAGDVRSALAAARDRSFDLVISDVGLPDGSGLDLMRQLKNRQPSIRGICVTGFGSEQDIRGSIEAGFVEHITKPVDFDSLLAAIARAAQDDISPAHNSPPDIPADRQPAPTAQPRNV